MLDKPEGVHVDLLATKTGLDAGKLGRILRLLATKHCFREGAANYFVTRVHGYIDNPQSNPMFSQTTV